MVRGARSDGAGGFSLGQSLFQEHRYYTFLDHLRYQFFCDILRYLSPYSLLALPYLTLSPGEFI
jgi:hypothetical protein